MTAATGSTAEALLSSRSLTKHVVRRSALLGIWLIMPIPVAGAVVSLLAMLGLAEEISFNFFPLLLLLFYGIAGAMWARGLARIFGWRPLTKFGWVGALGITIPTMIAITVLGIVEPNLLDLTFDGWRMHILFGLLFVPTAFLIAAISTGALGFAAGDWRLGLRLALFCGLTAALTFLAVTVLFDSFGMRVGAARAAERATMLVVTLSGMWAAALTGNAVLALVLRSHRQQP